MVGFSNSLQRRGLYSLARERMIGWYHSGPKLRASDLEINEVFKRFIPRPVMVIVDVRPQVVGIPTDAYFAVEEIKDVSNTIMPMSVGCQHVLYRTVQRLARHSYTYPRQSRLRKQRRLESSTFYAT